MAGEAQYWKQVRDARVQTDHALMTVESANRAATSEYREALETGNAEQATNAAQRMAEAAAARQQLNQVREQIIQTASQPSQPADPVERYVAGRRDRSICPRTVAWASAGSTTASPGQWPSCRQGRARSAR